MCAKENEHDWYQQLRGELRVHWFARFPPKNKSGTALFFKQEAYRVVWFHWLNMFASSWVVLNMFEFEYVAWRLWLISLVISPFGDLDLGSMALKGCQGRRSAPTPEHRCSTSFSHMVFRGVRGDTLVTWTSLGMDHLRPKMACTSFTFHELSIYILRLS